MEQQSNIAQASEVSTLSWMDRSGALTHILKQAGSIANPRLSPNGEQVVFSDEQGKVKMLHMDRGTVAVLQSRGVNSAKGIPMANDWLSIRSTQVAGTCLSL